MRIWRKLHEDQRGLEGIEYLLISAVVIIASIGAWKLLRQKISASVTAQADTIDSVVADSVKGTPTTLPPTGPTTTTTTTYRTTTRPGPAVYVPVYQTRVEVGPDGSRRTTTYVVGYRQEPGPPIQVTEMIVTEVIPVVNPDGSISTTTRQTITPVPNPGA